MSSDSSSLTKEITLPMIYN